MGKLLIFGNSGSGKSTLAKRYAGAEGMDHLDLDTLAWLPASPPQRAPLEQSGEQIRKFIDASADWVIEGCYCDLLELVRDDADEIVFMNLDVSLCIENAKRRPWEPHKYESKEAQDRNLGMLIEWIREYSSREGVCSYKSHLDFYERFDGKKTMYTGNPVV